MCHQYFDFSRIPTDVQLLLFRLFISAHPEMWIIRIAVSRNESLKTALIFAPLLLPQHVSTNQNFIAYSISLQ
ncbi:unnamed protein product [Caenorhabditis nigoni]